MLQVHLKYNVLLILFKVHCIKQSNEYDRRKLFFFNHNKIFIFGCVEFFAADSVILTHERCRYVHNTIVLSKMNLSSHLK